MTILLLGCTEIKTDNATESYKKWSGTKPPKDIELLKGQYWQSSHWTKEYIIYLKIKPSRHWFNEFKKQNHLVIDNRDWTKPDDSPSWFDPQINSTRYSNGKDFDQGSRYLYDSIPGIFYLYEVQL